jgi:hypothetical protein
MLDSLLKWGFGVSSSPSDDSAGSPLFSYVLLGAAVLLLIAVIFGELENV